MSRKIDLEGKQSLATGQVTIGTTATQIVPVRSDRRSLLIAQHGTSDVFIGKSNVTTGTGLLLVGVKGTIITLQTSGAVYGIVASGSQVVSFEEEF